MIMGAIYHKTVVFTVTAAMTLYLSFIHPTETTRMKTVRKHSGALAMLLAMH